MNEEVESIENFMINNDLNSTIYTMPSYSYHLLFSGKSHGIYLYTYIHYTTAIHINVHHLNTCLI